MAAVFESVSLPRSPSFPSSMALSTPTMMMGSSAWPVRNTKKVGSLPQFKGLKVQFRSQERTRLKSKRIAGRGGSIVCEAQDTTALEVPSVSEATWQSVVLDSDLPALVEFWAPWCGPCRMIHPVIDELAKQYAGKLRCFKLNTDESPSIATQYGIRSIPTVMIFKNGEKKDAVIGAVPKTTLTASIEKFL